MIQENLFEKALLRVNFYLKVIGLGIDRQDCNRSFIERIRNRWFFIINILWLSTACTGQLIWFVKGAIYGTSTLIENTHIMPCLTLCSLGVVKTYFIVKHANYVNILIQCLTNLQLKTEMSILKAALTKKWITFLMTSNSLLVFINASGVSAFVLVPIIKTSLIYYRCGTVKLGLPFLVWYPFDSFNISYWPFTIIHQFWAGITNRVQRQLRIINLSSSNLSGLSRSNIRMIPSKSPMIEVQLLFSIFILQRPEVIQNFFILYLHNISFGCTIAFVATSTVFGPDCLYNTSCAFIHIQFRYLQYDLKDMIIRNSSGRIDMSNDEFNKDLRELVDRHRVLIRCINLLEIIYSKSTLFNVLSSSLVICVTGFNILAIDDLATATPFIFFLGLGLVQIYLFCYYGNTITNSGIEVSDAIYDSNWYTYKSTEMKNYLFIMIRSQSPCKLTAYGFSEINLKSFGRILRTAWSYFALLVTLYSTKLTN